jgi:maleylpyruvate isomerase
MPQSPRPTLYTYWRSSSSYRVRIALNVKRIAYEPQFVDLRAGVQLGPEFRQKNPMGFVPCLVLAGDPPRLYSESVAIMELLDELYPEPPLYPRSPHERARVRALVETVNAGIQPFQNLSVLERVSEDAAERKTWLQFFLSRGLQAIETHMMANEAEGVKGRYAYGDVLSAADCVLVPQVFSARRFDVDLTPYPRVVAAADRALEVPEVLAASPDKQPDAKP